MNTLNAKNWNREEKKISYTFQIRRSAFVADIFIVKNDREISFTGKEGNGETRFWRESEHLNRLWVA
jgi:hypothetical protein